MDDVFDEGEVDALNDLVHPLAFLSFLHLNTGWGSIARVLLFSFLSVLSFLE